jgi:hypothetical protein
LVAVNVAEPPAPPLFRATVATAFALEAASAEEVLERTNATRAREVILVININPFRSCELFEYILSEFFGEPRGTNFVFALSDFREVFTCKN